MSADTEIMLLMIRPYLDAYAREYIDKTEKSLSLTREQLLAVSIAMLEPYAKDEFQRSLKKMKQVIDSIKEGE